MKEKVNLQSHSELYSSILNGIPDEPRVFLGNYLLDLVNESDTKERSLYVNNVETIIGDLWGDIVGCNYRDLDVMNLIPEKLGVTNSVFYGYKNGKKRISIQILHKLLLIWQEYCDKSDDEVGEKWDEIFNKSLIFSTHSKHQKTFLPRHLTPKLSYLLGWICGDGHLKESHNYLVKISEKSTKQLEFVLKPLFKELFGVNTPIFRRFEGGYAIQIGSKPIFRFLTQVLNIKVGKIPAVVDKMDKVNKRYFLAGIFDSEGYVSRNRYLLAISQANLIFLEKLMDGFWEFGINLRGPVTHRTKLGTWYTIQVGKKNEVLKFAGLIGSYHVDKRERLQLLVDKIEKNRIS